jgi:hypothetical protein
VGQAGLTTWRPAYVPHVGQAVCAGFFARQARFSQVTRAMGAAFQLARRERVFDRDIRRFGTATVDLLAVVRVV